MIDRVRIALGCIMLLAASAAAAQSDEMPHDMSQHQDMDHSVTALPRDCERIMAEHEFTVHAGAQYSAGYPGTVFGYSQRELVVEPCSRITVTLVNDDQVRHQWMVHGLPRYLYPGGMFYLETNGGQSQTGSFVVPSDNRSYVIHCDVTQHMEKGMKAQIVVGRGSGDLWAIPGVSASFNRDRYLPRSSAVIIALAIIAGLTLVVVLRRYRVI